MTISVDSPSACQRHVTVTVARADVDRYFDEAVGELMGDANVPGSRRMNFQVSSMKNDDTPVYVSERPASTKRDPSGD